MLEPPRIRAKQKFSGAKDAGLTADSGAGGMDFGVVFGGVQVDILPPMPPTAPAAFRRLFSEIGTVDAVGVEERVAKYTTRSIKKRAKLFGLKLAVSMLDLTTLEGTDTPG